jgi:hypothetical protein
MVQTSLGVVLSKPKPTASAAKIECEAVETLLK